MKRILYLTAFLSFFLILQSCKKDHLTESKQIVIDTTIASGTEYILDLKPYGDRDDVAFINKQASNYIISEIRDSSAEFAPVYHYLSYAKTSLSDQVVLRVSEGNRLGTNHPHSSDSTTITINFTIQ